MIVLFEMNTFVRNCKTLQGAMDLARYLERRFPAIPRQNVKALRFHCVLNTTGKVGVFCAVPFNEVGKADIDDAVKDFVALKKSEMSRNATPRNSRPAPNPRMVKASPEYQAA